MEIFQIVFSVFSFSKLDLTFQLRFKPHSVSSDHVPNQKSIISFLTTMAKHKEQAALSSSMVGPSHSQSQFFLTSLHLTLLCKALWYVIPIDDVLSASHIFFWNVTHFYVWACLTTRNRPQVSNSACTKFQNPGQCTICNSASQHFYIFST